MKNSFRIAEEQIATLAKALREIIRNAPAEEPEYDVWSDTEDAERWGVEQGHWEAALIARRVLEEAGLPVEEEG